MLTYLEIARRYRPRWIVWENVPGVLSSNGGRDFGSFLGALGQLGYGWAYRVLDAQWFGVAQRRRRVFVVGHLGDWRRAAKVLFERESVRRDTPPSRKARKDFTGSTGDGIARCVTAGEMKRQDWETCNMIAQPVGVPDVMATLLSSTANISRVGNAVTEHETYIPMAIPIHDQATRFAGKRGDKQDGKGNGFGVGAPGDPAPTLTKGDKHAVAQPVAFEPRSIARNAGPAGESPLAPTLRREMGDNQPAVRIAMQVRRLTPTECERLQGFPDGYTNISWRKKPEAPDGPRYKALGNSMAVPCMK
jgi:DNA (cytosine-5)-methyltransferase 1